MRKLGDRVRPVIVPPALTNKITDPAMVDVFMDKAGEKPYVLIIEDADTILIPRESDNIAEVSTLLNLTDGIIGQSLDIRVVLTTNTGHKFKPDPALTRPGRLCREIEFPWLVREQALKIAEKLGKSLPTERGSFSIAEIYSSSSIKEKDNKIGYKHDF